MDQYQKELFRKATLELIVFASLIMYLIAIAMFAPALISAASWACVISGFILGISIIPVCALYGFHVFNTIAKLN